MTDPESTDYARPWSPPPRRLEKVFIALSLLALVGLAANTVNRGAFLKRPMTDAQVFFRGAWAIWSDAPLFEVTDDNGWHYHYPLFLAVALRPLADAPPEQKPLPWTFPYPLSLFLWFAIGFGALVCALVKFGNALDRHALGVPLRSGYFHRWWALRFGSLLAFVCITFDGLTRGQVSTLLLISMVGFAVAYADRRPVAAGLWLSFGIAVKVFPAILVVVPILRRDWRCVGVTAVGLVAALVIIPAVLIGPDDTVRLHRQWVTERLSGIASGSGGGVSLELNPMTQDMIGFGPSIHRAANLIRGTGAREVGAWTMSGHWLCSFSLLALICWAGHGRVWAVFGPQPGRPRELLLFAAAIIAASVPMVNVAQTHYWTLGIPMCMCVVAESWRRQGHTRANAWLIVFAAMLWLAYLVGELRRGPLADIAWLTLLGTGLVVYGSVRLRSLRPGPAPHVGPTSSPA